MRTDRFPVGSLTRLVEANLVRNTRAPTYPTTALRTVLSLRRRVSTLAHNQGLA